MNMNSNESIQSEQYGLAQPQQHQQQHHQIPPPQSQPQQQQYSSYHQQYSSLPNVHQYEQIDAVQSFITKDNNTNGNNNDNGGGSGGMFMSSYNTASSVISSMIVSSRGDASIRPNVGLTNSYEYALFGLAPNEIIEYHKKATIILSLLTTLLIILTTVFKRFLHPAKLILSFYLAFFVTVLSISDTIHMFYNPNNIQQQQYEMIKDIREFIIDNFGLLLYPYPGRVFYLSMCGTICIAIGGTLEFLFGFCFIFSAFVTLYCWLLYPEYRKPYEEMEEQFLKKFFDTNHTTSDNNNNSINSTDRSWSSYQGMTGSDNNDIASSFTSTASSAASSFLVKDEEKQSLIRQFQESYQQKVLTKKQKQRQREQQYYNSKRKSGLQQTNQLDV